MEFENENYTDKKNNISSLRLSFSNVDNPKFQNVRINIVCN